jgi:hypothetical protein
VVTPIKIKEDRCFPVVDNMIALYHHIPDSPQRTVRLVRLIEESERGLRLWGRMATPVYPDGFFTKEKLFDGGSYHNGDVWTWFSNKYAIALIRMGWPTKAVDLLKRQAEVAVRDGGFSEFYEDDAQGAKKGAFHFAGAASSYLQAVVEGLFGLRMDAPAGKVQIQPALLRSGEIRCRLGRHAFRVTIQVDETARCVKLTVATPFRGKADLRIPLPVGVRQCRVLREGQTETPGGIERKAEAAYAVFSTERLADRCAWEIRWYD